MHSPNERSEHLTIPFYTSEHHHSPPGKTSLFCPATHKAPPEPEPCASSRWSAETPYRAINRNPHRSHIHSLAVWCGASCVALVRTLTSLARVTRDSCGECQSGHSRTCLLNKHQTESGTISALFSQSDYTRLQMFRVCEVLNWSTVPDSGHGKQWSGITSPGSSCREEVPGFP